MWYFKLVFRCRPLLLFAFCVLQRAKAHHQETALIFFWCAVGSHVSFLDSTLHAFQSASLVTTQGNAVQSHRGRNSTPSVHKETGGASCFSFSPPQPPLPCCPYGASEEAKGPSMAHQTVTRIIGMIDLSFQATKTTRTISRKSKPCVHIQQDGTENRTVSYYTSVHPLPSCPSFWLSAPPAARPPPPLPPPPKLEATYCLLSIAWSRDFPVHPKSRKVSHYF